MKKINIKLIGLAFLVVLALGACKKWIKTDINTSPDFPSDVPMGSLLTGIQTNMGYNTIGGNDICRVTSIWLQYFQGIARQSASTTNYILRDGDVNNQWITDYTNTMMNLYTLMGKAKSANNPTFLGIGEVLMANSLGIVTDVWGDIPYSQAFQGMANLSPAFDSQQSIYAVILGLLDDAIKNLALDGAPTADGDVMYGGDPSLWLKAAHALNARYILHQSKIDPNAWTNALAALAGSISSNDEDLQFTFYDAAGMQNPLYQFMNQRAGDLCMHKTFIDTIWGVRHDPRTPMFATLSKDTANPYLGAGWSDAGDNASLPGDAVGAAAAVIPFVTYVECLFIKAECLYKTNAPVEQVRTALLDAVTASMEKWGADYTSWMVFYSAYINVASGVPLYKEIMMQKWIALYNQAEAFADWRRTENIIGLVANPTSVAAQNVIPRRFPYPLSEKNYNSNTPLNVDIWQRVWWDPGMPTN